MSDSLAQSVHDSGINKCLALVSMTILYYEYALTFEMERVRFWSPLQLSTGTVIFFLLRYVTLLGHVPVLVSVFLSNPTELRCRPLNSFHQYMAIIIQALVGAVMILRMYALYERSKKILAFLLGFALCAIAFGAWSITGGTPDPPLVLPPGIVGCINSLSFSQAWHLGAAWSGVLVFDTFVFGLTVYKTRKIAKVGRRTFIDVLLRDGAMYFCILGFATLANVMTFMVGRSLTRGIATTITNVLASTMSARLMLNVRDPKVQWKSNQTTTEYYTTTGSYPLVTTIIDLEQDSALIVCDENDDFGIEMVARNDKEMADERTMC